MMNNRKIITAVSLISVVAFIFIFATSGKVCAFVFIASVALLFPIYANKLCWFGIATVIIAAIVAKLCLPSLFFVLLVIIISEIMFLFISTMLVKWVAVISLTAVIGLSIFGLWWWHNASLLDVWRLYKTTAGTVTTNLPAKALEMNETRDLNFTFNGKLDPAVYTVPATKGDVYQFSTLNNVWMLVNSTNDSKIGGIRLEKFLASFSGVNNRGWEVPPQEVVSVDTPDGTYSLPKSMETLTLNEDGAISIRLHAPKFSQRDVPGLLFASVKPDGASGYEPAPLIISMKKVNNATGTIVATPSKPLQQLTTAGEQFFDPIGWVKKEAANINVKTADNTSSFSAPLTKKLSGLWETAKKMTATPTPTPTPPTVN
jgi:hypothetical protein